MLGRRFAVLGLTKNRGRLVVAAKSLDPRFQSAPLPLHPLACVWNNGNEGWAQERRDRHLLPPGPQRVFTGATAARPSLYPVSVVARP